MLLRQNEIQVKGLGSICMTALGFMSRRNVSDIVIIIIFNLILIIYFTLNDQLKYLYITRSYFVLLNCEKILEDIYVLDLAAMQNRVEGQQFITARMRRMTSLMMASLANHIYTSSMSMPRAF
jgi:hypothetical protein